MRGLIVLALVLAGCLSAGEAESEYPTGPIVLRYREGDAPGYTMTVGNPVKMRDADGAFTFAHPVWQGSDTSRLPSVYFADDLRVVRDDACHQKGDDCLLAGASYSRRAYPLPMGIGWTTLLNGTTIEWEPGDSNTRIEFELRQEDGETWLRPVVPVRGYARTGPIVHEAWYRDGSVVPYRLVASFEATPSEPPRTWTLQGPGWAGPSESAPRRAIGAQAEPGSYLLFPDEGTDVMGWGFTPRDAIDWLLQQEPSAKAMLQGGCVSDFTMRIRPTVTGLVPVSELNETSHSVAATISDGKDSMTWRFVHESSLLGKKFADPQKTTTPWPTGCESTGPTTRLQDALERSRSVPQNGTMTSLALHASGGEFCCPGMRTLVWSFGHMPNGTNCDVACAYTPYTTAVRADSLLFEHILVAERDFRRIDQP